MSMNQVVSSDRPVIAFFGMRNAGKSSLINQVSGQSLSIVSDTPGTTTDPVRKAMELLPAGPVVLIDTPGLDDIGELGALRVERSLRILEETSLAVLTVDSRRGLAEGDRRLMQEVRKREIPLLLVWNKADLAEPAETVEGVPQIAVSASAGTNIRLLKDRMAELLSSGQREPMMLQDIVTEGDQAILVIPIDSSAPKGRIILPQQQVLRELLDIGAVTTVLAPEQVASGIGGMKKAPKLVITDSQAFEQVAAQVPEGVLLTSFSILMARKKGNLTAAVQGAKALAQVQDGDRVLISEGCTHHRQCQDIGTVKLPGWIRKHTGAEPVFDFTSGREFPADLSPYRLVVQCGGCMLNEKEMQYRYRTAAEQQVPMVNYGIAIAEINGILDRSIAPFPEFQ